jgi:hypothetical protein
MDFRVSLKELARLRALLEEINETRAQLEAKLAETPDGLRIKLLKEGAKMMGQEKDALEENIKAEAAKLWQPGQPKEIIRGVRVREGLRPVYHVPTVIAWAAEWAKTYVKTMLDTKAFEKALLAGALPDAPAEIKTVVTVALDQDLSDYLPPDQIGGAKPDVPRMVSVEDAGEGHDKT